MVKDAFEIGLNVIEQSCFYSYNRPNGLVTNYVQHVPERCSYQRTSMQFQYDVLP